MFDRRYIVPVGLILVLLLTACGGRVASVATPLSAVSPTSIGATPSPRPAATATSTPASTSTAPATAAVPFDPDSVVLEEITFDSAHFTLVGDLQIPSAEGQYPLVIMVHGDGGVDRGSFGGYAPLMRRFLRAGYAVFSWDKPGTGASSGEFQGFERLLSERGAIVADAVAVLQQHPSIDPQRIGLWGVSQAGYVMPLALEMTDSIAFMIVVSGPGCDSIEQTAYLVARQAVCGGTSEGDAARLQRSYLGVFNAQTYDDYRKHQTILDQFAADVEFWHEPLLPEESWSVWDRDHNMFFNPIEVIERTSIPVLAFFGENDTQVDPLQGAEAYTAALRQAGNLYSRVEFIPGVDHGMLLAENGCLQAQSQRTRADWLRFAPQYLNLMETWLLQLSEL